MVDAGEAFAGVCEFHGFQVGSQTRSGCQRQLNHELAALVLRLRLAWLLGVPEDVLSLDGESMNGRARIRGSCIVTPVGHQEQAVQAAAGVDAAAAGSSPGHSAGARSSYGLPLQLAYIATVAYALLRSYSHGNMHLSGCGNGDVVAGRRDT